MPNGPWARRWWSRNEGTRTSWSGLPTSQDSAVAYGFVVVASAPFLSLPFFRGEWRPGGVASRSSQIIAAHISRQQIAPPRASRGPYPSRGGMIARIARQTPHPMNPALAGVPLPATKPTTRVRLSGLIKARCCQVVGAGNDARAMMAALAIAATARDSVYGIETLDRGTQALVSSGPRIGTMGC